MTPTEADEKLRQIVDALPRNHQTDVQARKDKYQVDTQNCNGYTDPAQRQTCLNNARDMLQTCLAGCGYTGAKDHATELADLIAQAS